MRVEDEIRASAVRANQKGAEAEVASSSGPARRGAAVVRCGTTRSLIKLPPFGLNVFAGSVAPAPGREVRASWWASSKDPNRNWRPVGDQPVR